MINSFITREVDNNLEDGWDLLTMNLDKLKVSVDTDRFYWDNSLILMHSDNILIIKVVRPLDDNMMAKRLDTFMS